METYDKNMIKSEELDELRRQVDKLKAELDRSNIITQRIMRRSMQKSSSWLDSFVKAEVVSIPLFGLLFGAFSWFTGTSFLPVAVLLILSVVSVWFDWRTLRIASKNILTLSMSELRRSLIEQKKYRLIQTVIETPIAVCWLIWYVMSIKSVFYINNEEIKTVVDEGIYIVLGVGIVIALVITAIVYFKAQETNDEMIKTIDTGE